MADAHRDGKRFIVHPDEKLTAFIELELALAPQNGSPRIRQCPT
jgi:hypothetical protein